MSGTPKWILDFMDAVYPGNTELARATLNEKQAITDATNTIRQLRESIATKERELAEARREIERLTGVITGDAEIKQLVVDEKGLRLAASHPMMHALACEMASFFKSAGGINYVEVSMCHQEEGPFVLTLQRREGKTPNDLKAEAEKERDAAREAIRGAVPVIEAMINCIRNEAGYEPTDGVDTLSKLRSYLTGAGEKGGEK